MGPGVGGQEGGFPGEVQLDVRCCLSSRTWVGSRARATPKDRVWEKAIGLEAPGPLQVVPGHQCVEAASAGVGVGHSPQVAEGQRQQRPLPCCLLRTVGGRAPAAWSRAVNTGSAPTAIIGRGGAPGLRAD